MPIASEHSPLVSNGSSGAESLPAGTLPPPSLGNTGTTAFSGDDAQQYSSNDTKSAARRNFLRCVIGALVCIGIGALWTTTKITTKRRSAGNGTKNRVRQPESKSYTQFQGLGFQIYTGGAPVYLSDGTKNPECRNRNSWGHLDEEEDDGLDNLYCYLGDADDAKDAARRLQIMNDAVERAYQVADPNPNILKIFNAPEFFWRGKDGAYFFEAEDDHEDVCGEVCQILMGLEELTAQSRFEDWLFMFGTVITAEKLPKEDEWDYIFLNFAPLYRGYNPNQTTHTGQRFLVPKRYVSNIDFLTPLRHYNKTLARQIIDEQGTEAESSTDQTDDDTTTNETTKPVFNPFLDRGRYNNQVWDKYKEELDGLEYTMIEYDWVIIDGIVFTVEVCLDHDMATALNSYTADAVTGRSTRIPNVNSFHSTIQQVPIPTGMAQVSLVSSAGMSVNKASIATTNNGYVFLQDGLNDKNPRMFYETECYAGLTFEGGTELIQRYAVITPHDVLFEHRLHADFSLHPVYKRTHTDWKVELDGIFSAAKYEPRISRYPPVDIAPIKSYLKREK